MEKKLEEEFINVMNQENVTGCVLADQQGLCLMTSPNYKEETAGLVTALAQYAAQIEPTSGQPVVFLENDTRQCLIHNNGGITSAVFKELSQKQSKA